MRGNLRFLYRHGKRDLLDMRDLVPYTAIKKNEVFTNTFRG